MYLNGNSGDIKNTCNICRIMASGALSLIFPTNTVVTGGFSSFSSYKHSSTPIIQAVFIYLKAT